MQFRKFTLLNLFKQKGLLLLNIFLLIFILIVEGFPGKIATRLKNVIKPEDNKDYNFKDNEYYIEQTDFYTLYNSQRNIVMLGNSLTYRMHWSELLGRQDVANRGIGSDITKGFIYRLSSIVALKPKICFIEGGLNDIFHEIPADSTISNLSILADSLRHYGIKVALSTVTHIAGFHPKSKMFNPVIQSINEKIRKLADEKNLYLIDLNPEIAAYNELKADCVLSDGVHLTSKAYLEWKKQVIEILKKENM